MDGNRRWAREKGLRVSEGHRAGYSKLHELALWAKKIGIKNVILYMLSTENWSRSREEVEAALDIFRTVVSQELDLIKNEGIRICLVGQLERFPEDIQKMMRRAAEETKTNEPYNFILAVSYGGRAEIVHAVNDILSQNPPPGEITEEDFESYLWTKAIPDPDLIIRTGREKRLSNFLLWQSVYSELFFVDTHWPDFSEQEFKQIIEQFAQRERRRGR